MAKGPRYVVKFRRRREGKTNYRKRLALLKSGKARFVFRRTLTKIIGQVIIYEEKGDKTLVSATSEELRKFGWKAGLKNVPASYLTGLLLGLKAKEKGINEGVFDLGLYSPTKGNRAFAFLKGLLDANIEIPHSEDKFPSEDRIRGEHIANFEKKRDYHFSQYQIDLKELPKHFEEVKEKIINSFKR
ncbi:MAG TPA: 50S ribosomal protein L18 [Nautiliaceae bacterium]|nr:50S ribosomal protein L18 [Nautiliaceae bacterium]